MNCPVTPSQADAVMADLTDRRVQVQPVDWESVGAAYLAQAKRESSRARYEATVREYPEMADTDWSRPQFDKNRPQIDRIRQWQPGKRGILAAGPSGRGKSRSIFDLYRRLSVDDGLDVRYWSAARWFSTLQEQVSYGRDTARGWIEVCADRPILILEDLGQEAVQASRQDWAQAWFFHFLDLRIGKGLPLIITTNLTATQMADQSNSVRSDPLLRRLGDLTEVIKFI
jgi:DNA replication protein DnaC